MSLNKNKDKERKENPFKSKAFYITYILFGILPTVICGFIYEWDINYSYGIMLGLYSIPSAMVGMGVYYPLLAKEKRSHALGMLLGGYTPLMTIFIFTGGCGLVVI